MTTSQTGGLIPLEAHDPEAGLLAYAVGGKITDEQAQSVFDEIKRASEAGRSLRIYYELEGFPSGTPSMMLEKLKMLGTILKTIERMAIVGDQRWLDLYQAIINPITKMEIQHFKTDQRDAALTWIRA